MLSQPEPLHRQVAAFLCRQVLSGAIAPGEPVAPVRELAMHLEVNPQVVEKALHLLATEGLLPSPATGYILPADAAARALQWLRNDFIRTRVPELASRLRQLQLTPEELVQHLLQHPKTDHE